LWSGGETRRLARPRRSARRAAPARVPSAARAGGTPRLGPLPKRRSRVRGRLSAHEWSASPRGRRRLRRDEALRLAELIVRVDARQLREVPCARHRSRSCRMRGQPPEPLPMHRRVAHGLSEPRRHCSTNRSTRRTRTGVQRQPRLQSEPPTAVGSAGDGDARRRRSHRSLCSYNAQAAGCTSAPGPDDERRDGRSQRPFARFPASESVLTADSWAGKTEDRWGLSGTSGETTYTASAEHRLRLLDVCDVLAQMFGSAMAVARSLHH